MRLWPILFTIFPTSLFAENILVTSDVSAVTLYPQGATVTRRVPYNAPAGQHDLILADLPQSTPLESIRVDLTGATLGSITTRRDFIPPRDDQTNDAIITAEAEIEQLEARLRDGEAGVEAFHLENDAAEARVTFLNKIGEGESLAQMDATALRELTSMIGEETLIAKTLAHDAHLRAKAAERGLKDLQEELEKARQALRALVPETKARAMLAVAVSSDAPAEGVMTITYNIPMGQWRPVYDLRLDRKAEKLAIDRGAFIYQNTGENWEDVQLTLSTVRPSEQTAPSQIMPWHRQVESPDQILKRAQGTMRLESDTVMEIAEAPMEQPMVGADLASFDGLAATYVYTHPVSLASGADHLRIALGGLELTANVFAKAVPLADRTAFLMADVTNDSGELMLPGLGSFYLDGRYIGQGHTDLILAGGKAELPFGAIDGLQLTRIVQDRNEGDRGMISRSNEITETVQIKVENLTKESWPMRVLGRVPYSEQEDLEITWTARPHPTSEDVDGNRGILSWEFDLGSGDKTEISLTHSLEWPEGKVLR